MKLSDTGLPESQRRNSLLVFWDCSATCVLIEVNALGNCRHANTFAVGFGCRDTVTTTPPQLF